MVKNKPGVDYGLSFIYNEVMMESIRLIVIYGLIMAIILLSASIVKADTTTSQTISIVVNEIAELSISGGAPYLNIIKPDTPGQIPSDATDSQSTLEYSSNVASGRSRTITVAFDTGESAPAGCSLKLEAIDVPAGCGNSTGPVTVSTNPQPIITGIGGCATEGNGPTLVYTLHVENISQLRSGSPSSTVTFTLTSDL